MLTRGNQSPHSRRKTVSKHEKFKSFALMERLKNKLFPNNRTKFFMQAKFILNTVKFPYKCKSDF